jgi:Ni,Fe-hydrogenase III small subunit
MAKQAQVLGRLVLRLAVRVPENDLRHFVVSFAATPKPADILVSVMQRVS